MYFTHKKLSFLFQLQSPGKLRLVANVEFIPALRMEVRNVEFGLAIPTGFYVASQAHPHLKSQRTSDILHYTCLVLVPVTSNLPSISSIRSMARC